jgi:pimeloyl-ACP methyl ester carboxylesterase
MPVPAGLHATSSHPHPSPDQPAPPATPHGGGAARVVIVHGAMDRSASFGRVARQLGHLELVRYDRRGYGRSVGLGPAPLARHIDDLEAVLDDRPAVVFGHSIGGVIALAVAQRRPDLVGAVLAYESPTPWAPWWPPRRSTADRDPADEAEDFMRRTIGDRIWERLPARTRADRRAEGPALLADLAALHDPAPYDPVAITVPVLAAAGAETTWWHRRATAELAEALPLGRHVVVAGAGHAVHLSHPTATAHLIDRAVAAARPTAPEAR